MALDTQMPNLATLFEQDPWSAWEQVYRQQGNAQANQNALLAAFQQDQAQKAAMNPLELERTRLQNTGLDLGNIAKAYDNQFTSATQPGRIAMTNSQYGRDTVGNQAKETENLGDLFGATAAMVQGMTPFDAANVVQERLGKYLPQHPALNSWLISQGPNLSAVLQQKADAIYANSSKAREAKALDERMEQRMELQNRNALALEELRQTGKMEMSRFKASNLPEKKETLSQYEARIADAAARGDVQARYALDTLNYYKDRRVQLSAMVGDDLKRTILQLGNERASTPVAPQSPVVQRPVAPVQPAGQPPVNTDPTAGGPDARVRIFQDEWKAAKASGNQANVDAIEREMKKLNIPIPQQAPAKIIVPQGFVPLGDGTYRTPDGRIVRPKQ